MDTDDRVAWNRRQATKLVAGIACVVGVVLLVVFVLLLPVLVALPLAVVLGAGAAAGLWVGADPAVRRRIPSRPADPTADARLLNLVEGLCASAGVPQPEVRLVEDPAANALVLGRDPRRSTLLVTTGLVQLLSRMELEGVIAQQLAHIKDRDPLLRTLVVALQAVPGVGGLALKAAATDGELRADLAGVGVTRYPPGLLAALEKLRGVATEVGAAGPSTALLWFTSTAAVPAIEERIEVLREL